MTSYGKWMTDSVIARETNLTDHWGYEYDLTLDGIAKVWQETGEQKYFDYIVKNNGPFHQ